MAEESKQAKTIKLRVISPAEAEGAAVLEPTPDFPKDQAIFANPERPDLPPMVCGNCERVLVSGMELKQITQMVMKCPDCGALNETLY